MKKTLRLIIALAVFVSTTALSDVIQLKNGDRITGKIKKIWDDEIFIEPDYADEFAIDIAEISTIQAADTYALTMKNGARGDYQIAGVNEKGELILLANDSISVEVPINAIAELEEIKYFDWSTRIDVNTSVSKGNTESQSYTYNSVSELQLDDHRYSGSISAAYEQQLGTIVRNRQRVNGAYNYLFNDPWFLAADFNYERDPIASVAARYSISPSIGYDVWYEARRTLRFQLGAGYQDEEAGGVRSRGSLIEWRTKFSHRFYRGDLEIFHNNYLYKNLNGRKNTVLNSETGFRYDITEDIYLNVQLNYDHDSKPIVGTRAEDTIFVIGAGIDL